MVSQEKAFRGKTTHASNKIIHNEWEGRELADMHDEFDNENFIPVALLRSETHEDNTNDGSQNHKELIGRDDLHCKKKGLYNCNRKY